jgi:hypothetical protein
MKSWFRVTTIVAVHVMMGIGAVSAETLSTHRIPALLAAEAADEVVAGAARLSRDCYGARRRWCHHCGLARRWRRAFTRSIARTTRPFR